MRKLLDNAKRLSFLKQNYDLPLYKRFLYNEVEASKAKIVGLYGARGVGKTTLMLQLLKEMDFSADEAIYISCDHPMFSEVSLFDFVDEFSKRGGKYIVIDEVHEAKDFQAHLKSVYDFLDVEVLFSGSSAIAISNPDFVRRYSMYRLPAFSLREYLELTQDVVLKMYTLDEVLNSHETIVSEIFTSLKEKKILKYYQDYSSAGAYPFYFEDPDKYVERLGDMINTALHTDLATIFKIPADKIDTLKKLLLTICVSKPLELSIDKLASTSGITKVTLYKYIDYLSRAELIRHISHEAKRFKSMRKPDKLYLANTNLFNALCINSDIGTRRETYFAAMTSYKHSLYYVDKGDFLLDEKITIEVGGENKGFKQIKDIPDSYVVADDIEIGSGNKVPLWLFGFLY